MLQGLLVPGWDFLETIPRESLRCTAAISIIYFLNVPGPLASRSSELLPSP